MPQLTKDEFVKLFYTMCSDTKKYSDAYEAAEQFHEDHYGIRRYSNYDSFRKVRDK
jgi:hypothetical protein